MSVFLCALITRCVLVAVSGLFESFALDDSTYHQITSDMASGDISHWDDYTYSLFWSTATFSVPVTGLYELFGSDLWIGQLYVALLGALTAVVVTAIALEFLDRRWAIASGVAVALLPSQVFWSSQLMKDASVWLALAVLSLLIAVAGRASGRRLAACWAGIALCLVGLAFLREHTLVVAAWAVVVAAFAGLPAFRIARVIPAVLLAVAIPWLVAGVGPGGWSLVTNAGALPLLRYQMAQDANTAIVDTTPRGTEAELDVLVTEQREISEEIATLEAALQQASPRTGSDRKTLAQQRKRLEALREEHAALLAEQQEIQSPPAITEEGSLDPSIKHLPRGLSVMLLEPLPLPFSGSTPLRLARLESLLWYPLLILAGIGLWRAKAHLRVLLFPLVAGAGILLLYALSEGNIGTAHRHRGELVWVVALLAGYGASRIFRGQARAT
ncbi:MAG: hypothetical protein M3277_09305 [Actinomycetota bacterium]|nr:hypothetical protein [Actinomycetota bacterium]